ncbi:MAG: hypothetical protein MZV63_23260 [Marinilabiliales bacterium]|nr:hypothetical protein [Marinilabiliales bacterium]
MQGKTRKREIVQARQVSMYFSKSLTKASLASIGLDNRRKGSCHRFACMQDRQQPY